MNLRGKPLLVPNSGEHRATAHYSRFQVRMLSNFHFEPLVSLRKRVVDALPDPDQYVPEIDEPSFINDHCGAHGESIGVFSSNDLIAYAMLGLPDDEDTNTFPQALNLNPVELTRTAFLSSCMVLPGFRGHGLQRALISSRLALARVLGRDRFVAMVSPINHISRQNLFESGLRIVATCEVGGHMRQIMSASPELKPSEDWQDLTPVEAHDIDAQTSLIGEGFHGIAQTRLGNDVSLVFGRPAITE